MTEPGDIAQQALSRASAANALGRYTEALREARVAFQLDPSLEGGYGCGAQAQLCLNRPARALKLARAGLAVHPQSEWLNRLACAAALSSGKKKEALAFADEAVRLQPNHSLAHKNRGHCLEALRRRKAAREAYELAIELAPHDASHLYDLGSLLTDSDPTEAVRLLRKALELDPLNAATHNDLGVALLKLKCPEEAMLAFKTAVRLDPTLKAAKRNVHSQVSRLLGNSIGFATIASMIYAAAKLALISGAAGLGVATIALLVAIIWFSVRQTTTQRREELDPDLLRLYDQIDADRKAKRL